MAKEKSTLGHKIFTGVGIALCVILIPILIINCILLIKGWTNQNEVPSIGGYAPMIVLTDSMVGEKEDSFNGGDLIFVKKVEAKDVKKGDVISFFDPAGNGSSVVSHRVIEVINEDGKISFKTKGDNNNTADKLPVLSEKLIGKYTGFKICGAGSVAMFMQTTWGLIICVLVPIILLVGYDAIRRAKYNKKHAEDKDALLTELEELRRLQKQTQSGELRAESGADTTESEANEPQ